MRDVPMIADLARPYAPEPQVMPFGELSIAFDDRVLRPRPWTIAQAAWAASLMARLQPGSPVLELCAGAGHIGLLALRLSGARHRLLAIDVSPAACEFTTINAAAAGLAGQVEVREGLLENSLDPHECFELVVADPPWVPQASTKQFPDDPLIAINGGPSGLDGAVACLHAAEDHLSEGGSLLLQLGSVEQVAQIDTYLSERAMGLRIMEFRNFEGCGVVIELVHGT